ncbi:MAG: hypothetical protein L6Q78_04485 [Bacteroidia bacterium]|nr:hypothetical protein [Bacteroidia bacterium]
MDIKRILLFSLLLFPAFLFGESGKSFVVFGEEMRIRTPFPALSIDKPLDSKKIESALVSFNEEIQEGLLNEFDSLSEHFSMDDLAWVIVVREIAKQHYNDPIQSDLFLYLLLKKKSYESLLGYSPDGTTVYGYLDFPVANLIQVKLNNRLYSDLSFDQKKILGQEELFGKPTAGRAITLNENKPPAFHGKPIQKSFYFEYESFPYCFKFTYESGLTSYLKSLPDIEISSVYLNYSLSETAAKSFKSQLSEAVASLPSYKRLDFILQFSQEAINYRSDKETIGIEKFSFAEETLAAGYGDCEDKSILFGVLARDILNLKSLALIYYAQEHLNVAVESGDKSQFSFQNKNYLVCEPSGKGYKPGDNVYDLSKASLVSW